MHTLLDLHNAIASGQRPVITFKEGGSIDDADYYAEGGMRARIVGGFVKTYGDNDTVVTLRFAFADFEQHNLPLETATWFDKDGQPTMTARQKGYYHPEEDLTFPSDLAIADLLTVEDDAVLALYGKYVAEKADLSYLQWLEKKVLAANADPGLCGATVNDVLTLRPDLTEEEADHVVDVANQRFDASMGCDWRVLRAHADDLFRNHVAEAALVDQATATTLSPIVVDFSDGNVYCGTLADVDSVGGLRSDLLLEKLARKIGLHQAQTPIVQFLDQRGTFIDLEKGEYQVFGGDVDSLHNSITEFREEGATFLKTFAL